MDSTGEEAGALVGGVGRPVSDFVGPTGLGCSGGRVVGVVTEEFDGDLIVGLFMDADLGLADYDERRVSLVVLLVSDLQIAMNPDPGTTTRPTLSSPVSRATRSPR